MRRADTRLEKQPAANKTCLRPVGLGTVQAQAALSLMIHAKAHMG